jgi:hypothetical protein
MNRSEARLGVGAYDNNEWRLDKFGRWMEYACGVKSETIKLDSRVPLRCAWNSFLSEEMLGCMLRVSLEYASRVSGYDTPTRYRLDSLSIPGWLDIRSWTCLRRVEKLTAILLCNWLKISQYGWFIEYPESFRDCSIRCASNRHASNNLNQTWKFRRTWKHGSHSQISLSQFHADNIQWKCAASTDSHKRIYDTKEFD